MSDKTDNLTESSVSANNSIQVVEAKLPQVKPRAVRERLPDERRSVIKKFRIAGQEGYIIAGFYDDGRPGEIFIHVEKPPKRRDEEGREQEISETDVQIWSMLRGFTEAVAISTSLLLQVGVPLKEIAVKHRGTQFYPSGFTKDENIPRATSILDYVFRWLQTFEKDDDNG